MRRSFVVIVYHPLFIIVRGDMEEDSYIVSNFHSICRLCLKKNGVMSSLFDYVFEDSEVPLYERISELAELQVCLPLPQPTRNIV